jgi:1-acyl-sn-glycerol-3-phosphate acyltransferase
MLSAFGYSLGAHFFRIVLAPFTRRRVIGLDHVPHAGPAILAPNHISHFDPPLIGISADRQVDWMAMEELFENPLLAAVLRWIGSFPVGRGKMDYAAVRTAIERLKRGRMVGVFPEGGLRTGPASVLEGAPLKPGVAALAQMTQARVIPCAVIGTDALYNPGRWLPWRNTAVWIIFGEPLAPPAATGDKSAARAAFDEQLGNRIRELYQRTVREEKIPADCLPQTPQKRKGREL